MIFTFNYFSECLFFMVVHVPIFKKGGTTMIFFPRFVGAFLPNASAPSFLRNRLRIAVTCALVAGCASESETARATVDPRIVHACTVTMEASEGTTDYENCVSSIVGALEEVNQENATRQAWANCASKGMVQNSPAFARCVLARTDAISTARLGDAK